MATFPTSKCPDGVLGRDRFSLARLRFTGGEVMRMAFAHDVVTGNGLAVLLSSALPPSTPAGRRLKIKKKSGRRSVASALLTHPLAFHYQEVQTHINTYSKSLNET